MQQKESSTPLSIVKMETNALSTIVMLKKDAKNFQSLSPLIVQLKPQDVQVMLSA
jgi:hypothetical protein